MGKRIMIMAGGTGGHVFPALAVAKMLQKKGWQVSWMGTRRGLESRVVPDNGIEIDWLTVAGVRGKGLKARLQAPLMLMRACWQALRIIRRRKPDVVLGMGGFVAGPGGIMTRLVACPLVIHEQNRIPGTTNRLLARYASVVMEAFPGSFSDKVNAVFTGNPLRDELIRLSSRTIWDQNRKLRILVVGGSQGAKILNEIVVDAATNFPDMEIRHQTGKAMRNTVWEHYKDRGLQAEVVDFIDDMADAYQWADMVICRSGAMTVSELAAAGLPSIMIPFPSAIDDHQTANAHYLSDAGAGILISQHDLSTELLISSIKQVIEKLKEMSESAYSLAKLDATEAVVEICLSEAR